MAGGGAVCSEAILYAPRMEAPGLVREGWTCTRSPAGPEVRPEEKIMNELKAYAGRDRKLHVGPDNPLY